MLFILISVEKVLLNAWQPTNVKSANNFFEINYLIEKLSAPFFSLLCKCVPFQKKNLFYNILKQHKLLFSLCILYSADMSLNQQWVQVCTAQGGLSTSDNHPTSIAAHGLLIIVRPYWCLPYIPLAFIGCKQRWCCTSTDDSAH